MYACIEGVRVGRISIGVQCVYVCVCVCECVENTLSAWCVDELKIPWVV